MAAASASARPPEPADARFSSEAPVKGAPAFTLRTGLTSAAGAPRFTRPSAPLVHTDHVRRDWLMRRVLLITDAAALLIAASVTMLVLSQPTLVGLATL